MTKTTLMALVEASGLREVIDDAYLERGDWTPFVERFAVLAQEEMRAAITEVSGCFEAALFEGWEEAITSGDIERIRDIWDRRISHVVTTIRALEVKP